MEISKHEMKHYRKARVFESILADLEPCEIVRVNKFHSDPILSAKHGVKTIWPDNMFHFVTDFKKYLVNHSAAVEIRAEKKTGTILIVH